jgi:prepilin-type N-terminal cleavage/methylation domain-containing protein
MKNKANSRGFSLIELSVAIAVLGVIIYTTLAVFAERSAIDKVAVTERKMDVIEKAIHLYFKTNADLPCAADGTFALTHAAFAVEDCAVNNFGLSVSGVVSGVVPTRTLNLPDDYMFDGWGRRFTYFVTTASTVGSMAVGNMIINDRVPLEITSVPNNRAVYVLISHGENGVGAWRRNGGATRTPSVAATTSVHELENAAVDISGALSGANITFRDDLINDELAATAADYFDDIVRWKTKGMIDYDADRLP